MTYAPDAEELATFQRVRDHFGWDMTDGRTPNLNKALSQFQGEMPAIERDRKVEVETKGDKPNYSYSYATLANIVRVASPIMAKYGLAFTSAPGAASDGKGMSVRWALVHESGEERTGEFPISAEGGIQVLGGRITYVKRYCFAAALNIAADEDDDAAAAQMAEDGGKTSVRRNAPAVSNKARSRRPAGPAPEDNAEPLPGGEVGADGLATNTQKSRIILLFKDLDMAAPEKREQRNGIVSKLVGRDISTITALTGEEADAVIPRLVERVEYVKNNYEEPTTNSEQVDGAVERGEEPGAEN